MTTKVHGKLDIIDPRHFGLIGYRAGHSYALFRGFPSDEEIDDSDGDGTFRLLDICFADLDRISCWRSVGPIHLRYPAEHERAALIARIGPIPVCERLSSQA
jgi:hypothetical protein